MYDGEPPESGGLSFRAGAQRRWIRRAVPALPPMWTRQLYGSHEEPHIPDPRWSGFPSGDSAVGVLGGFDVDDRARSHGFTFVRDR